MIDAAFLPPLSPGKLKGLAGRMLLDKGHARVERLFLAQLYEWETLIELLEDPIGFLKNKAELKDDAVVPPVTLVLRPVNRKKDSYEMQAVDALIHLAANTAPSAFVKLGFPSGLSEEEYKDLLADDSKGWYLIEFANQTHVLTIYYQRPLAGTHIKKYKDDFTQPNICTFDTGVASAKENGQVHFDLGPSGAGLTISQQRALFLFDYVSDRGTSLCETLNLAVLANKPLRSNLGIILTVGGENSLPVVGTPDTQTRFFTTASLRNEATGPTLIVEGVLPKGAMGEKDPPTFVCLQNGVYVEGNLYTMEDGTLKVYTAPPGP